MKVLSFEYEFDFSNQNIIVKGLNKCMKLTESVHCNCFENVLKKNKKNKEN